MTHTRRRARRLPLLVGLSIRLLAGALTIGRLVSMRYDQAGPASYACCRPEDRALVTKRTDAPASIASRNFLILATEGIRVS